MTATIRAERLLCSLALPLALGLAQLSCGADANVPEPQRQGRTGARGDAGAGDPPDGPTGSEGAGCEGGCTAPSGDGLVLRGGSVVDPRTRTIARRDLYVCNGRIVDDQAGPQCASTVVDVTGKWLVPGLSDMHVHARGVSGGDGSFVDMTIDDVAATFRIAGVTSFLDAMNDEARIFPLRDGERASGTYAGADVFASGGAFTPTRGHGTEYGLPTTSYHIVDTAADAARELDALAAKHPDVLKIFYDHRGMDGGPDVADGEEGALGVAMRKEVMIALVEGANARHIATEVHIGVWSDARDAIAAGATCIAHLGEPAIPDDVVAAARAKNVFWIPTLSLYHGYTDVVADPTLLDDPLLKKVATPHLLDTYRPAHRNVDTYTLQWLARHTQDKANVAKLAGAGVPILAGTDVVELGTFIGWSLHRELVLLVDAGLSPWDALAAATTRAGDLLGHDYGIAPGAEANVLVLGGSPIDAIWSTTKLEKVIHHGRVVTTP